MLINESVAGTQTGGWMQRLKDQGQDPAYPGFCSSSQAASMVSVAPVPPATVGMVKPGVDRKITMKELAAHATSEDPWFVIQGEVRPNQHPNVDVLRLIRPITGLQRNGIHQ